VTDALWVLPLLFVAFYLDRPLLSGFFYGLACATKQTPWFLAPFLLVYMMRAEESKPLSDRLRRITVFAGATIAIFLAVNIAFITADLTAWLTDVLTPMAQDLVIQSQGFSLLTQVGLAPVAKDFYTALVVSVSAVLIVNYYVYFDKLRYVFWIFPGIILWFSYRALTNYVIYWMPLMLVSLILWYKAKEARAVQAG
jgi:uncharacterized membrane protein